MIISLRAKAVCGVNEKNAAAIIKRTINDRHKSRNKCCVYKDSGMIFVVSVHSAAYTKLEQDPDLFVDHVIGIFNRTSTLEDIQEAL